ncbi:MAG: diguanylate cyclase domain-containing protein, partial [Thermodesulfobacteriota bacterium]
RKSFVATDSGNISFTTSIGFDQLHATDTHTDQILARADNALYRAKTNGRDRAEAGCGDSRILQH